MGITPRPLIGNAETENTSIEYKIVREEGDYADSYDTYMQLEEEVNGLLAEGWSLQGGVSVGYLGSDHFCICQAMVKYPERKIEKENDLPGRAIVRI